MLPVPPIRHTRSRGFPKRGFPVLGVQALRNSVVCLTPTQHTRPIFFPLSPWPLVILISLSFVVLLCAARGDVALPESSYTLVTLVTRAISTTVLHYVS